LAGLGVDFILACDTPQADLNKILFLEMADSVPNINSKVIKGIKNELDNSPPGVLRARPFIPSMADFHHRLITGGY